MFASNRVNSLYATKATDWLSFNTALFLLVYFDDNDDDDGDETLFSQDTSFNIVC